MRFVTRRWFALALLTLALAPLSAGGWSTKSILKQVDKATKNARWVKAEVDWNEFLGDAIDRDGTGKVWVDLGGRLRAEVERLTGAANPPPAPTPYGKAIELARHGRPAADVASNTGISRGEADLIVALYRRR